MVKKIFYSYSHKDKAYLEKLQTHIKPIIKEYDIKEFVDEHIRGGEVLDEKIMPNEKNHQLYNEYFKVYKSIYQNLKNDMKKITELQKR